ncbi:CpsD/CapB family tyrosine-protein kinase [Salinicoccus cyprini]|uniref:non-specific protein-tyrosine kinase n=1 Tax=Salinicoccus cyprini TaxID=2493691 RepID=A0A558AXE8_9STAP|nr:CpsD/CapB family tyrosine-protein kinase [Salinicoccus cyprini]TVT28936.1 CpsD/CapB family tyrosine-protein kinase [Salinicoccus cyprini]
MFKRKKKKSEVVEPRNVIVANKPHATASEQFRTIRTNIMYAGVDDPIRSVLFTSAISGAGKSTIAANMAIAYAQAGIKTLLLDGDLRRPTSHYTFEVSNRVGLSSAMVNDIPLENLIRKTEFDTLDLITSGPIPPNPSELLSSKKMAQFMNSLNESYEMVIMDSPPILSVTDPQLLCKQADGVVLVTDVENNNRDQLVEAKDLLDKAGANIIGVVLNHRELKHGAEEQYYYTEAVAES